MESTVYHLDDELRIVEVNEAWNAFARANGAPELAGPACLGQSVLACITDPTTAQLYLRLFEWVRGTGEPVEVPFRCDAPELRRFMRLRVEAEPRGFRLQARLLRTEIRTPASLEAGARRRPDPPSTVVHMCSWCKSVQVASLWCEIEDAIRELRLFDHEHSMGITYVICPMCLSTVEDLVAPGGMAGSGRREPSA